VVLRVAHLELTRLPWGTVSPPELSPELARYAADTVALFSGDEPCPVTRAPRALRAPRERAVLEWQVRCPTPDGLAIESRFLLDVAPGHLHFARLRSADGATVERVLSSAGPRWALDLTGSPTTPEGPEASSLPAYVRLGMEHIATGTDHLLFLLGLLLLASRAREVITIVTGFTLAHSFTLALAALGRVRPEGPAVDALIGLSIALVAAENAWLLAGRPPWLPRLAAAALLAMGGLAFAGVGAVPSSTLVGLSLFVVCYFGLVERVERPTRLRFAIAFCFGLVHGFGFAGVLSELALPADRLLPALFGFNAGVEVGQLGIVLLVWPVLRRLADLRAGAWHRVFAEAATAAVCGVGVFWLLVRSYG
jgi:hypothetical protein